MALFRSLTTVFAVGMIGGAGVLMMLPLADEVRPVVAQARIPDPPAAPCKQQSWPNADRNCLKWTAPRATAQKSERARASLSAHAMGVAGAGVASVAVAAAQPAPELRKPAAPEEPPKRAAAVPPQPVAAPPPQPAAIPPADTQGVAPPLPADIAFAAPMPDPPRLMPAMTSEIALAAAMAEARSFAPPSRRIATAAPAPDVQAYAARR